MLHQITLTRLSDNRPVEVNVCENCGWSGENSELILWGTLLVCGYCGQ